MRRALRYGLLVILVLAGATAWLDAATYDARAWQADYRMLKRDMAQGYANLDWIVAHRKLDLAALDRDTTAAIDGAHSRVRAWLAIRHFVRAFDDPHVRLTWGARPVTDSDATTLRSSTSSGGRIQGVAVDPVAGTDCVAAGYEEGKHAFVFPFARIAGWTPIRDGDFPTGMLGDIGVLRIAQFGEDRYAATCALAFKAGIGRRALQLQVRDLLQRKLAAALRDLRSRGAKRLLVDVAGNGGGSEWVTDVTALLTERLMSREQPRVAGPRCDRIGIWRGQAPCPVLAEAGSRATLQGTGAWPGPVLVLVDASTASASEDLVAWLQQNGIATVIGERTRGAGCGYLDGGTRTRFRASRFDVVMPNCARFLDDGRNEIEGIAPDIAIPMHLDDAQAQADMLAAALGLGTGA